MRAARAACRVSLGPEAATALWRDPRRWPGFVEGFQRIEELGGDWPADGEKVVWESGAGGRGRVTEKVKDGSPTSFTTQIYEQRLVGTQSFTAAEDGDGSRVEVQLEYELTNPNPLRVLADVLFIRRALRDALTRTLRRFAVEADEDAGLR